jgi:hypothetical protein
MWCRLLIIRHLLIIIGLLLIVVVVRNTSRSNAKGSQLGRSKRGIGVWDGWEGRYIRKLLERLIRLVNGLLITPHNLKVLIQQIHALIRVPTHDKDTLKNLQDSRAGTRSG